MKVHMTRDRDPVFMSEHQASDPGASPWWRAAAGTPAWARPAVLTLTAIAAFGYAWNTAGNLEIYYAAAVRSMSMSWHNFLFAAFDPAGTTTVDKLPGALWVQALFVGVFGVHAWAILAPQVIEGMASVLVLYRVARRLSGPVAGIVAATVLVCSPATMALDRGNIPDTLMILLVLLAADATVSAATSGRLRGLIWAGVLVGLAFQAKMAEAWLVAPALALGYLLLAGDQRRKRLTRIGIAGLVMGAVSVAWMAVVSVWPATGRPYVDGSSTNSIFSQVFVYNGLGRIDQLSPNQLLTKAIGLRLGSTAPGWDRLITGALGRDTGWLVPAALVALVACGLASRGGDRLLRGGVALWGTWLIVLLAVFSASSSINAYYTAALSPPVAALLGMGASLAWEHRANAPARMAAAAAVAASFGYALWLVPSNGVGTVAGIAVVDTCLGIVAVLLLVVRALRSAGTAAVAAAAAILAVPAIASASVVTNALGPFDTPFESSTAFNFARALGEVATRTEPLLPPLERAKGDQPDLMATQTSALAAPFIYDTGQEVLPIGGYTGTIPVPSLATLKSMIARGDFHLVIQAPTVTDQRLVWIAEHCLALTPRARASPASVGLRFVTYYCGPPPF